ncbi:hypothetical protein LSH36_660g03030, partial [Paralvinella palmiformis]
APLLLTTTDMAHTDGSVNSNGEWKFLNISDIDPKQIYHKVETTINGVTKKILVPVMNSQIGQKASAAAASPPVISSLVPIEPVPITIAPEEVNELGSNSVHCGLQISDVTSLKPFIDQPTSGIHFDTVKETDSPTNKAKGTGQGRGRGSRIKNSEKRQHPVKRVGRPRRSRKVNVSSASTDNNDAGANRSLDDPEVLKGIIYALMSERVGLQKDMPPSNVNKDVSNIVLEHPELPAHQGKMLIHVGQNPDGSHIYKTFDICTTKNHQRSTKTNISVSDCTDIMTTVVSDQSPSYSPLLPTQNSSSPAIDNILQTMGDLATGNLQNSRRPVNSNQQFQRSDGALVGDKDNMAKARVNAMIPDLPNLVCAAQAVSNTKCTTSGVSTIQNAGVVHFPLMPIAGQQVAGSQASIQVMQTDIQQKNTQPVHTKPVTSQMNASNNDLVTSKAPAVIIRPLTVTTKQPTSVTLPRITPVGNLGPLPIEQGKDVLFACNSSTTCATTNIFCQQPTVVRKYSDSQGQFIVPAPTIQPSQPILLTNTAFIAKSTAQYNPQTVGVPSQSLPSSSSNGSAAVKQNQWKHPVVLQNAAAVPNSGIQPMGVLNLGISLPYQNSFSTNNGSISALKRNQHNQPQILQDRAAVGYRAIRPAGSQDESNLLNSIYGATPVNHMPSRSTTVVNHQGSPVNHVSTSMETTKLVPEFGQLQGTSAEGLIVKIGDVDVATLLNIAKSGNVKDISQEYQEALLSLEKKAVSENVKYSAKGNVFATRTSQKILSNSSDQMACKQTSPLPLIRRQVDINVGHERTIYPKTPINQYFLQATRLHNAENGNEMFPKCLPSVTGATKKVTPSGKNSSEDRSSESCCSIVNLMKQDLAMLDKDGESSSSQSDLIRHLLKPCKVVLERIDLSGRTCVNLKRCKLFPEAGNTPAKKCKSRKAKAGKYMTRRRSRRIN